MALHTFQNCSGITGVDVPRALTASDRGTGDFDRRDCQDRKPIVWLITDQRQEPVRARLLHVTISPARWCPRNRGPSHRLSCSTVADKGSPRIRTGPRAGGPPARVPSAALTSGICRFNRIAVTGKCGGRGFWTLLVKIQRLSIASRRTLCRASSPRPEQIPHGPAQYHETISAKQIRSQAAVLRDPMRIGGRITDPQIPNSFSWRKSATSLAEVSISSSIGENEIRDRIGFWVPIPFESGTAALLFRLPRYRCTSH